MNAENNEWIKVQGLRVKSHIGVPEEERAEAQELLIDFSMQAERNFSEMEDDLGNTLDYHAACLAIEKLSEKKERRLIETLADEIAELLLTEFHAIRARVTIRKFILARTEYVAVSLERNTPT